MSTNAIEPKESLSQIKWWQLIIIFIGGGIIYLLPYMRGTYYQPLQEALHVTNTQLGVIQSTFGILTILCYFPGGWLADRVSPRKLLTTSFLLTGIGGFVYATFPPFAVVVALHFMFGITVTLTFWAAMIKATRLCGPANMQGRVFGILEGGRRFTSTLAAFIGVAVFTKYAAGVGGLRAVILTYSCLYVAVGILTWFTLTDSVESEVKSDEEKVTVINITKVLRMPIVWIIALIVLCAYVPFRNTDFLTPYLTKVCGVSAATGALLGTIRYYGLGPVGAITSGFISDKINVSKAIIGGFSLIAIFNILYVVIPGSPKLIYFIVINMCVLMIALFAVRGVYFALLEEGHVPVVVTGIATGVVSTIGFLPDVFSPIIGGYFLDLYPGALGYKYIFMMSAVFAMIGILITFVFRRRIYGKTN